MIQVLGYLWAGVVIGVSFLATPVKFRAKSLTMPVAVDVGRATFHLLGKLEWLLSILIVIAMAVDGDSLEVGAWALAGAVLAIVIFQAGYLIPKLDVRVAAVIAGTPQPKSHLHTAFAVLELIKVGLLIGLAAWAGASA